MPIRPILLRKHYTYPRTSRERYELKKIYKRAIGVIIIGNGQEFIVKDGRFLTIKYPEFGEILEVVNAYMSRMMVDKDTGEATGEATDEDTGDDTDEATGDDTDDDTDEATEEATEATTEATEYSFAELNHSLRKFMALADEFIVGHHHNIEHR